MAQKVKILLVQLGVEAREEDKSAEDKLSEDNWSEDKLSDKLSDDMLSEDIDYCQVELTDCDAQDLSNAKLYCGVPIVAVGMI